MNLNVIGRPINWFAKGKIPKKVVDYAVANSTNAAKVIVAGNLLRDGINCGFYTWQSYNNEKIPKEKRGFVAALDLSNGVLNIVSQFLLGNLVLTDSLQEKLSNRWFGEGREKLTEKMRATAEKLLEDKGIKIDFENINLAKIEKQLKESGISKYAKIDLKDVEEDLRDIIKKYPKQHRELKDLVVKGSWDLKKDTPKKILFGLFKEKQFKDPTFNLNEVEMIKEAVYKEVLGKAPMQFAQEHYSNCSKGLKAFTAVFITTIFAKRMIVPFLATPSAGWLKDKYMNTDKKPATVASKDNAQPPVVQNNAINIFELYDKTKQTNV